ncbi:hypothetical protein D3C79_329720 [compost metagenome]
MSSCPNALTMTVCSEGCRASARRAVSMPSISGICQSTNITRNGCSAAVARKASRATPPQAAATGESPAKRSMSARIWRAAALSSTTSTRAPASSAGTTLRCGCAFSPTPSQTLNENVLPLPAWESTAIVPPISSTRRLQMARPRPVPPYWRVVELSAWAKAWKSRPDCSGVMPMPVSCTRTWSCILPPVRPRLRITMVTWPCSVNFTALLTKLRTICPRRSGSPTSMSGMSGAVSISSSRPLS